MRMVTTLVLPGMVTSLPAMATPTRLVAMLVTCPLKARPLRLLHSLSPLLELGLLHGAP
jgi:hypothetical protein